MAGQKKPKTPFQKNDRVKVTITDISTDGSGIGKTDTGYTLFVKDAVPGDTVTALITKPLSRYAFARIEQIISLSSDRAEPVCPVSRSCGGCQLQPVSYEWQLRFKEQLVRGNLIRIGGLSPEEAERIIQPIAGSKEIYGYRNKLQIPVQPDPVTGKAAAGFYAGRSHRIVPVQECAVSMPAHSRIVSVILGFMNERGIPAYDETDGSGMVRHILIREGYHTGEVSICIVSAVKELPYEKELAEKIAGSLRDTDRAGDRHTGVSKIVSISLNYNPEKTNVILGKDLRFLWGKKEMEDLIFPDREILGDDTVWSEPMRYAVSPMAFYQVNPLQTQKLYSYALKFAGLSGQENVWDLYCGAGTISLFLARAAKHVTGIEIVPEAIADARRNASLNSISNADFYCGAAEDLLPQVADGMTGSVDVVVIDPPRKGLDPDCIDTIIKAQPKRIVYVSCDSSTLSRDISLFAKGGYRPQIVQPVDMFPQTVHVESVVKLTRAGLS
ncbi:MAG: 23S rRNA (uracil(1939)-C(5))-methyltransferase RlmD [Lachnospiraceae bacterium]|nr:23S rRNA (uracil(1939)-C(5))-methyltransferase RlmD [Lachnospiraceae bacterium]